MNRKDIRGLVGKLNDNDLNVLIAEANGEQRKRLDDAHRAIVLKNRYCPAWHFDCVKLVGALAQEK